MSAYSSKEYRNNRAILLADNPVCHWCRKAKATEADHLIELSRGGTHELDNLVPSCKSCNSRRGAIVGNKQQAQRVAGRKRIIDGVQVFSDREMVTPSPTESSFFTGTNQASNAFETEDRDTSSIGVVQPRLETPYTASDSLEPYVSDFARKYLGYELMDWQKHICRGMLAVDEHGKLIHRKATLTVARQNGKTWLLKPLIGAALSSIAQLRGRPQNVANTAHELKLASLLFEELAPIMVEYFGAKAKMGYGIQNLVMPDGSRWWCRAATPSGPHGLSLDWVIADEGWAINEESMTHGFEKTTRARPEPLVVNVSTAGTEASSYLQKLRTAGLKVIDEGRQSSAYFAEYSPPPGADIDSPRWWGYSNPSLGITITRDVLEAEAQEDDRAAFLRGAMNLWVATDQGWLQPGQWEACKVSTPMPAGGVIAVDSTPTDSQYYGLRAQIDEAGLVHVCPVFVVDTVQKMQDEVAQIMSDGKILLAITPTLEHHVAEYPSRKTTVGHAEIMKYTSLVRSMIQQDPPQIAHHGEELLAEHVNRAVAVRHANALQLSSKRSPGEITLARLMVFAAAIVSRPQKRRAAAVYVSR